MFSAQLCLVGCKKRTLGREKMTLGREMGRIERGGGAEIQESGGM